MDRESLEWDDGKNRSNQEKHGLSCETAQAAFFDPHRAKRSRTDDDDANGAWTMGGDPQEIIAGDFPLSSRPRDDV